MTLLARFRPILIAVAAGAVLVVSRGVLDARDIVRGFDLLVLIAMASAWNLVGGYGGLFSVGHSMFVGVGSYATATFVIETDVPLPVTLAATFVIAALLATVVALPLLRLRAAYFAVATLGIALAAQAWMLNWDRTGASTGLNMPLSSYVPPERQYLLAAGLAVGTVLVVALVVRSGLGLRLMALRDDEEAAAHIGIRRYPVALTTWTISGGLTGLAGALIALQKSSIEPVSAFSLGFALDMIVATVIGGIGTIAGPIVGAVIVYSVAQLLQGSADWATLVNGLLILVVVRFAPGGLVGLSRDFAHRLWGHFDGRRSPSATLAAVDEDSIETEVDGLLDDPTDSSVDTPLDTPMERNLP